MGIRARTALLVTATLVCTTVLLVVVFSSLIRDTFHDLEKTDAEKSVRLVSSWVGQQTAQQQANAVSYGAWTPTYKFVVGDYPKYPDNFLNPSDIATLNARFMVFLDNDGKVVFSRAVDPESDGVSKAPKGLLAWAAEHKGELAFQDPYDKKSMVVGLPEGVAIIGAAPVVTSQTKGPIHGTLIVGRILGDDDAEALAKATLQNDARVYSTASADVPADVVRAADDLGTTGEPVVRTPDDQDKVFAYQLQQGTGTGGAAVVAASVLPRTIKASGDDLLKYTIIGLVAFIFVTLVALILVLNTSVLTRLATLSLRVTQIGDSEMPNERVEVDGDDEIGELATSINGMLEAIDESRFELVQMATHDALTHVYNRRRFEEELARELAEFKRLGKGGALLWFDLDGFKEINDERGHAAGDQVLIWFAQQLRGETREYSTLARFGGDEFVMVIPGADEAEATRAAMRLLDIFSATPCDVAGASIRVSTSIGVALYPRDGTTVADLLARADTAMYRAKKDGRGRMRSYAAADDQG